MNLKTLKQLKKETEEEDYKKALKETLLDLAIGKAKQKYGEVLDELLLKRLNYEIDEFAKICDLEQIYRVLSKLERNRKVGKLYLSKLSLSNSLFFYLLGLGSVNPLPKHTYCSKCHTFYYGKKRTELCEVCETNLKEDGYDLPFEPLLDEIKNSGLRCSFSFSKSERVKDAPIRYIQNSLIELSQELGFSQQEIEENDIDEALAKEVINCILTPTRQGEISYYSKKYKKSSICDHHIFVGIGELGYPIFSNTINRYFRFLYDFDSLNKVMSMMHGSGVIEGNKKYIRNFLEAISTRDDLYQFLLRNQINKDDTILICRESRLCGRGHISSLSESKLIEAGIESKYIEFIKSISYIFHKGDSVAHTRLALKIAKIYLEDPLRYYKAFFRVNKAKLEELKVPYDFIKGLSESKSTDIEDIYLAAIDLLERGYDPTPIINEIKNN
ncbi:MAG: hypothetical protein SPL00_04300 [Bacilli bacterium]|nr:hypothetical protein [Bacilli bacterium]